MSAEVGVNIKEYIKLAIDTNELALADSQGHTTITPDPEGTLITGDVNVAVTTNTIKGYTLSIYTQDSSKAMSHSNSTVDARINSIDTVSGYDANSGASSLSNNTWGFRRHLAGGYGNWFAVGENESNGTIIDSTDEDDPVYCAESDFSYPLPNANCSSSAYNSYQIGFGAKLTSSLPAGTYTNNVVFSAVAKSEGTKYTMNFNANGGTNTMGSRTVLSGSNIVMPKTGFTKEGYGIKGWAMVNNATTATTPIFLANQTVAINDLIAAAQTAGQSPATTNSFTVYAVWDIPYTIAFNSNSGTGEVASQTIFQTDSSYTVPANGFTKEGYNFTGWALSASGSVVYSPADTPTVSSLISAAQAAGQSVTPGTAGTIKLYAVWEEATVWLQNFACDTRLPNIGDYVTAKDSRGTQKEYTVKKLADGNCWMMENLSISNVVMTDQDTNLAPNATFDLTTGISQSGSSGWCQANTDACDNVKAVYIDSTRGGYYNWYTATAGNGTYSTAANVTINYDICPKGWHLPVGGDNKTTNQFALLDRALGGTGENTSDDSKTYQAMNNIFPRDGYIRGSLGETDRLAYYWSSTAQSSNNSYRLMLNASISGLFPRGNDSKYNGASVRCVVGS